MIWIALRIFLALQPSSPELNSHEILVENVHQLAPHLDGAEAKLHLEAALTAAGPGVEPELLLAMAYVETRFTPTAISSVRGKRFCGPLQTNAHGDRFDCLVMSDLVVGYAVGAIELRKWLKVTRGDLAAALRGYGCGFYGVENECRRYDVRVLAIRARLASPSS
jgi:hypothetical protein